MFSWAIYLCSRPFLSAIKNVGAHFSILKPFLRPQTCYPFVSFHDTVHSQKFWYTLQKLYFCCFFSSFFHLYVMNLISLILVLNFTEWTKYRCCLISLYHLTPSSLLNQTQHARSLFLSCEEMEWKSRTLKRPDRKFCRMKHDCSTEVGAR